MTARLLRLARRLSSALSRGGGTHGGLAPHRALLLADLEGDLDALVDDAANHGIGDSSAAELLAIRDLIGWLGGGELPGPEATRYVRRAVEGTPRRPEEAELARRDAYLAALAGLGDEEAASTPRRSGDAQMEAILDLQGRKLRGRMEELGLTVGALSGRTGIATVRLVAVLFGREEMGAIEWIALSGALEVSLDWMSEGIRFVPGRGPGTPGFHRLEPDPRGSAGALDTPDLPSDDEGGDPR